MKTKLMLKIKYFSIRSHTNDKYDFKYILRYISSQTSTSNSKYKRNRNFFQSSIPLYSSHPIFHISQLIKNHIWRWNQCWKSKSFNFAHRQMIYITYNISQDAIQAKHRPLTPSIIETAPFFTITYAFTPYTQYLIYLNKWKVTNDDQIDAENQKVLVSLTYKWYIRLIIYLKMHSKPNIDL